jgi:hypothetical protein
MSADFFCKPEQWRPLGTSYEHEGDRSSLKEEGNMANDLLWFWEKISLT